MESYPTALFTASSSQRIASAKVLCVGAGGIGCELLKTLVMTGFRDISVIDLDTIETSNLNRQFLFRKRHVGQPKCTVAAEAVMRFCPAAKIQALHGNVKEDRFSVEFFQQFTVVLNGLDNIDARRHVNRMCLAANVPLVESGTAGYVGQTSVHCKGRSACYECTPKPVPKTFAICTIRNTPDKPIHCIVWAKELLFQRLFGPREAVTDLDDDNKEGGNHTGGTEPSFYLRREGESVKAYAVRIVDRAFREDIERLVAVTDMWANRAPPTPLALTNLVPRLEEWLAEPMAPLSTSPLAISASRSLGLSSQPQHVWSPADNARVLLESIALLLTHRPDQVGSLSFDKDDDLAVDFVTAAANLRSLCYAIPTQSRFDAKGMAGNIIHAVATTNAIVSGLIATEACKLVLGLLDECRDAALYPNDDTKRIATYIPDKPSKSCVVCHRAMLTLQINTQQATLRDFIDKIAKQRLGVVKPYVDSVDTDLLYEEGEDVEEDMVAVYLRNLPKTLDKLPGKGLRHNSIVELSDELQHFSVRIRIMHRDEWDEEKEPEGFVLEGEVPKKQDEEGEGKENRKRKASEMDEQAPAAKKAAVVVDEEDDIVLV